MRRLLIGLAFTGLLTTAQTAVADEPRDSGIEAVIQEPDHRPEGR